VQLGVPLQLHPVTEMVGNGNGHGDDFSRDAGKKRSVHEQVEKVSVDEDHT
jgi:hypothetical protein